MLAVVTLVAILCGRVGMKMWQAERQREAVSIIQRLGGYVRPEDPGPAWWETLHKLFPSVFFEAAYDVEFKSKNNAVSDADLDQIVKLLPDIEVLLLESTDVTDAGLATLNRLKRLQYLSLSDTQVSDAGLEHLKGLNQLHALRLNNTRVTDTGLEHLKLHHLRMLHLDGTQVTDAGLEHLKGHRLAALSLNDTKITDAGLEHLRGSDRTPRVAS